MTITLAHPLPGSTPTDPFGWRGAIPSIGLPAQLHNGQDYAAPAGAPIRAAHDGVVIWSGWDNIGGGWGVQVQHSDGWSTLYFHMRERSTDVTIGQRVAVGQTIGRVGATGMATGNHLHFMLRNGGKDIDPVPYIKTNTTNTTTLTGDEMFILVLMKRHYYLVMPATSKQNKPYTSILLGSEANDNGLFGKLPVVPAHTAPFTLDDIKTNISGIRASHLKTVK